MDAQRSSDCLIGQTPRERSGSADREDGARGDRRSADGFPGIQALFGFQLMAVFNQRFNELTAGERRIHYIAVLLIALAIGLIMTPAAYHRQVEPGSVSGYFVRLASRLVAIAMLPLAVALCLEVYLLGRVILGDRMTSFVVAGLLLLIFVGLWYSFLVGGGPQKDGRPVVRSPKTLIFDVEETALCKARKQPKRSDVHGRHPSWYERGALKLLREHDVALCLSDHRQAPAPWIATASHVYVRGHGPDGRYRGHYPDQTLKTWARAIRKWNRHSALGAMAASRGVRRERGTDGLTSEMEKACLRRGRFWTPTSCCFREAERLPPTLNSFAI